MRWKTVPVLALLGVALGVLGSACSRAEALESFELDQHDKLIAEAPGCYADCRAVGTRRLCTIREFDCRPICQTIPECKPDGAHMVKVCVVMKAQR